jgi:oligopeptide transport system substrate-binding protein
MKDKLIGSNKYLRQAMSAALNRDKWIQIFTNGTGIKAVNALPPGVPDRPVGSKIKYDFDLKVAKELLEKAGYPNGNGLPTINFDMREADSLSRQLGEFFTLQFAQIGIKLNVIYNTFPAYLDKTRSGNFQVAYGGWGMDYPDAENVYQLLYGPNKAPGPAEASFDNPEMNKLYEQMAVMESGPKRAAIVKQMDDILQEDCPWALGLYWTEYRLTQPWVMNYRYSEVLQNLFKYYRIDREMKKRYLEQK